MDNKKLYSIGEISTICGITIKTLRYYDSIGLIQPTVRNYSSGYRYYRHDQIQQICLVKTLKALNFSLEDIQSILKQHKLEYTHAAIEKNLDSLEKELRALQSVYDSGVSYRERLRLGRDILERYHNSDNKEQFPKEMLRVEEIAERDVIFIRNTIKDYHNAAVQIELYSCVLDLVKRSGNVAIGPLYVAYHQKPMEHFYVRDCDYEIGIGAAGKGGSSGDNSHFRHEKGYTALTTFHVGKYDKLLHPYIMMMDWIRANGYTIAGPMRDCFFISAIDTTDADKFVTKILIPVSR